jgi:hypothetical protein
MVERGGWVVTDGEAEAARSCSSRLGVPMMGEGIDLEIADGMGFTGTGNGKVDGRDD